MRFTLFTISAIGIVLLLVSAGCTGSILPKKGAQGLREYRDNKNLFSLNIPEHWTVSVGDAIVAADASDNGITKITIQPVHLSGKYLSITAGDIANYLIGKERRGFDEFTIDSVRESQDGRVLELSSSFSENGRNKKAVYSIFVNSPYAIMSKYETLSESMNGKEEQLRAVVQSFRQFNPPATDYSSQGTGASTIGQLQPTVQSGGCLLYTSPSPRDRQKSRMPSSA